MSREPIFTRHAVGDDKQAYCDLLSPFGLCRVGVFAPLDVLEDRERRRGDRLIGLARWQYERVHRDMVYDLEVDTGRSSPDE
ncbi:hypothetical protein AB4144_62330, partial [Rhizobiaceae sp. 2RAB30]